jgi:hypothetical protein
MTNLVVYNALYDKAGLFTHWGYLGFYKLFPSLCLQWKHQASVSAITGMRRTSVWENS